MDRPLASSRLLSKYGPSVCLLILLCGFLAPAFAQDGRGPRTRGAYSLVYEYIREGKVRLNGGDAEIGTSDTQVLLFDVDLSINDKWSFFGSIPFVTKRYNGDSPHVPETIDDHHVDEPFIDDGAYHSDFQDLVFGFRYALPMTRVQVEPYIGAGIPTNDYPIFAHAAVGQNLQRLDVGAVITYIPPFSNFYYSFTLTKAFVEQIADVNVDHWRFDGEIGYLINPRWTVRGYFLGRTGNGLEFPDDFPPPRNDLHWYEHEGVLAREYLVVGFGSDWLFNERNRLMFSALRSSHVKFMHEIDYGVTFGISRRL